MDNTEKMRRFIIRFLYIAIWALLVFCALKYAMPLIMPFFVAFVIAFVLKPVINAISKRVKLSRKTIAIIVLALFYVVIGGLLTIIGIRLGVAIKQFALNLPSYYSQYIEPAIATVGAWLEGLFAYIDPAVAEALSSFGDSIVSTLSSLVGSFSGSAVNMATSVGWFVVATFLCILASFFFVVDYYKVTSFIAKQLSPTARRKLFVVKDYVVNVLFKFVRAYGILMALTFVEVTIGLLILRVDNAFLIAAATAAVDILPVFGTGTVMIPWIAYSLITGEYFMAVGLAILYGVITVVRQILEPRVVGKQIGLYPLLTLICMFLGVQLFGFWGLFALPIAVTVLIHLNRSGEIHLFKE